jgi:hypothetical protein
VTINKFDQPVWAVLRIYGFLRNAEYNDSCISFRTEIFIKQLQRIFKYPIFSLVLHIEYFDLLKVHTIEKSIFGKVKQI